ncbi:MAG: 8-amino-7-oxononanoate synthase [Gammaproteobacteria bacterium]|nr:8-amino-7-oxononanoate synthase [Gammaproteobacteria bacterium]
MSVPKSSRRSLDERLAVELGRLREQNLYRVRRVVEGRHGAEIVVEGRRCVGFCSNDYLGLAADPRVAAAARRALDQSGTGSGAAALVSGYNAEHRRLEEALAAFVQRPRALLFSSGWAANLGVLRALLGREDTLIADELNHASLIDGGRLAGARYLRVAHRDLAAYEAALREAPEADALVATDSVFSMDGDLAPLPELARLCAEYRAPLMVDDAHGFGVLGAGGRGAIEHCSTIPDIYVATLGKSLGVAGAFVAGSAALIEYLIQRARTWVFSTAPPPALAAAARRALEIVQAEPERRERLDRNIRRFREGARQLGIPLGLPDSRLPAPDSAAATPIQPLILGAEARALALSRFLFERGYWVAAIRPPTVPPGTSRLRITLSAAHAPEQIDGLLAALRDGLEAERNA